jgi:hypothetical protein
MWKECFQFDSTKLHRFSLENKDPWLIPLRQYSLELIELSSINKFSLV